MRKPEGILSFDTGLAFLLGSSHDNKAIGREDCAVMTIKCDSHKSETRQEFDLWRFPGLLEDSFIWPAVSSTPSNKQIFWMILA
jgi:hypothetical protein